MSVAVVVPTCRPDRLEDFLAAWKRQFEGHEATVIVVRDDLKDGDVYRYSPDLREKHHVGTVESILGGDADLVPRKSPACRCAGFVYLAERMPDVDTIVTLDDDLVPLGDTIGDHLEALRMRVPVSWMSSTSHGSPYMRGFPYAVREEASVWVSHGVWRDIPDLDAPTQLVLGSRPHVDYYRGVVPKGSLFPVCGMNLAFRREALPLAYWCPCKRLPGAERFDDIWMGIHLKRGLDDAGAALVTGFAECIHTRLSDTFQNLRQEAVGIGLNEWYWRDEPGSYEGFFGEYAACRRRWRERMEAALR
jgi:reversibly glycosylated polypeptide/UDP-arabinopyranose mutase